MDLQRFPPEVASLPPHVLAQLMDVANEKASPTTIGFFCEHMRGERVPGSTMTHVYSAMTVIRV